MNTEARRNSVDFPDLESLERHIARLLESNRQTAVDFVLTELTVGLAYCRQIRESSLMNKESRAWRMLQAGIALKSAETTMWKTKMAHPDFDQMMALAERLKFEIDALK
jgi:hypothetical protein